MSDLISSKEGWNILQIIPAREGFAAVYEFNDGNGDTSYGYEQVVCLALVQDNLGNRFVTGLDNDLDFYEDDPSFSNYINFDSIEKLRSRQEEVDSSAIMN